MKEFKFKVWIPLRRGGGVTLTNPHIQFKNGKFWRVEGYLPEDCKNMIVWSEK